MTLKGVDIRFCTTLQLLAQLLAGCPSGGKIFFALPDPGLRSSQDIFQNLQFALQGFLFGFGSSFIREGQLFTESSDLLFQFLCRCGESSNLLFGCG